jgi:RNA polymerase sigma-70 factor (ECF subfamily)
MTHSTPDTDELLDRAAADDPAARSALLDRHRTRLRRMVAVRLDPRLAARVDPSDLVQDTLAEAARRLDAYLRDRPLPFYPWLRQFAADRLADLHRRHVRAARRSVGREEPGGLPEHSAAELADRLLARDHGPSEAARRAEQREQVRSALLRLPGPDREALTLRYLEELPAAEVAAVLGVSEAAAKKRVLRALERLRAALGPRAEGGR